jgi:hypothetical protein
MPWRPESHAEEGWWSSVMTELDVIDAHTKAAVTFHTLMDQHTPLGTPVQYERLLLRARGGQAGPIQALRRSPRHGHRRQRRMGPLRLWRPS